MKIIKKRNVRIDALKVLACFCVVALHTQRNINLKIIYNPIFYYFARIAIPIFFMVNGYLIMEKNDEFVKEKKYKKYFLKKLMGIVKIVLLWSIINSILYIFLYNEFNNPIILAIKGLLNGGRLGYYWFFGALALIYIILYLFYPIIVSKLKKIIFLLFFICLLMGIISLISIYYNGYFIQSYIRQTFRIWTWLFYFLLGSYFRKFKFKINKKNIFYLFLLIVISIIYQYILCYKILGKMNSEYLYDDIIIISLCFYVFGVILNLNIEKYKNVSNIITFFSEQIIGIYLLHYIIIIIFDIEKKCNNLLQAFVSWVFIILLCTTITYLIRKIPYIKNIFNY